MASKQIVALVVAVLGTILCAVAATAVGNERLGHAGAAVIGVGLIIIATGA